MTTDWLIVGAGFTGCTFAERIATQLNQRVLLVDRRPHIGGNAYDYFTSRGILIHKYGPHLFHTNSQKVWDYLSRFTAWTDYQHHVLAEIDGKRVPLPFNFNTIDGLFSPSDAARMQSLLVDHFGMEAKIPILKLREAADKDLGFLADFIYEKVFAHYTLKQWGLTPEELDPSVTGRVPVLVGRDDRYFQDKFQGMPVDGYSALFGRMVAHPNIQVLLQTDYKDVLGEMKFKRMVYSGAADAYFDFMHGELPYRSLRFELVDHDVPYFQEAATVNFPNEHAYTRITDQKFFSNPAIPSTTVTVEYPQAYQRGVNEAYYPVPREENAELFARYQQEITKLKGSVLFAGRLADYKYYNMDQAVARALRLFEESARA